MRIISYLFLIGIGVAGALATNLSEDESGLEQIIRKNQILKEGDTLTATVNDYADLLMNNFDKLMLRAGLDPMTVGDIEVKLSKKFFLVTYWGALKLSNVKVKDFSTIHRYDDAVVFYNKTTKKMSLEIPLELKDIKFSCHFLATLMGLGPSGGLDGSMKNVRMITSLEIDFSTFRASVEKYKITHTDHITVNFHESILIDWFIDLLANTTTMIFKELIVDIINKVVEGTLQACANIINEVFDEISRYLDGNSTIVETSPIMKNIGRHLTETRVIKNDYNSVELWNGVFFGYKRYNPDLMSLKAEGTVETEDHIFVA